MPDVKLTVTADTSGVNQAVNNVTQQADKAGKAINKAPKWNPVDLKAQEESYRKSEQLFAEHLKKMAALSKRFGAMPGGAGASGPGGAPVPAAGGAGAGGGGSLPPLPPAPLPAAGSPRRRGRHAYTYSPDISDVGRNLISGFGGGAGMISQYATRGAVAGAAEVGGIAGGGMLGGGLGLIKGLTVGTLALGALKGGQKASEGVDLAEARMGSLDTLKRQLGDLGVSFEALKAVSNAAAEGMGINSKEAAELAVQFNRLSRGAEGSAEGLSDAVRTGTGLSKAYGLDPSAGVGFLGNMRNIDPRQNNRELAIMLADTIARSGMNAKADEVMQAMTGFAQTTARMTLQSPNLGGFSDAYGSLMGQRYAGMTGDTASSLLMQANGSMTRMGAMGEAGMNFTYAAFKNAGGDKLNPFTARSLAEGGLFGSRASVFGDGSPLARLYGRKGVDVGQLAGGRGAGTTNLEAIVAQIERSGASVGIKNDMLRNYFGLGSDQQSAALYNMALDSKGKKDGGLLGMMQRAGIDPKNINAGGLQTMATIGRAGSTADLDAIYGAMAKRQGKGALTDPDKAAWDAAKGTGDFAKMQEALLKISSSKDKEETDFSKMTEQIKAIETAQIDVGNKLLVPLNAMRDGLLAMTGSSSAAALRQKVLDIGRAEINAKYDEESRKAGADATYGAWHGKKSDIQATRKEIDARRAAEIAKYERSFAAGDAPMGIKPGEAAGDAGITLPGGDAGPTGDRRARIAAYEKKYGLRPGMLLGIWGTESGFGKNIGKSSAGAMGHMQFMPETAARYGVKIGDADSEFDGSGRLMRDLIAKHHGDERAALFDYNGVKKNIAAGNDYVRKVQKNGGFHLDDATPMDARAAGGGAGGGNGSTVNLNVTLKQQTHDARGGVQERVLTTTKVAVPRGAGSVNVEAVH